MTFKFSATVCEICGLNRRFHNELQKQQCSSTRKKLHENDKKPRRKKIGPYNDGVLKYFGDMK